MKRLILLSALVLCAHLAEANDQVRNLQSSLKQEGFYFGEIDGKPGAELNAAIRRYQIRNGLTVTGEADDETQVALGLKSATPKKPATPAARPPAQTAPPPAPARPDAQPPVNLRRSQNVEESDRRFLEETRPGNRPMVRPPAPLDPDMAREAAPSPEFGDIFIGTPYATAPAVVQRQTVERAQEVLARQGFYREPIDGLVGPATEEAILTYQRSARLPLTGRLDLQTLARLRLLPGRSGTAPRDHFNQVRPPAPRQQILRGIWVR